MQMDPAVADELLPSETELIRHNDWTGTLSESQLASFFPTAEARAALDAWPTPVTEAAQAGTGRDNPSNAYELTQLQSNRSMMIMLEGARLCGPLPLPLLALPWPLPSFGAHPPLALPSSPSLRVAVTLPYWQA